MQKKEKGSKSKKGRWMRDGRGRGWEMAEAECGLNSRSATCYLAVAITGSNVFKPTAASGVYTRGKRWFEKKKKKKLIARVGIRGHIYII